MIKKATIVTLGLVTLVSLGGCKFGQNSQKDSSNVVASAQTAQDLSKTDTSSSAQTATTSTADQTKPVTDDTKVTGKAIDAADDTVATDDDSAATDDTANTTDDTAATTDDTAGNDNSDNDTSSAYPSDDQDQGDTD